MGVPMEIEFGDSGGTALKGVWAELSCVGSFGSGTVSNCVLVSLSRFEQLTELEEGSINAWNSTPDLIPLDTRMAVSWQHVGDLGVQSRGGVSHGLKYFIQVDFT